MTIDLTYAGYRYEWTKPLWDGRVHPQGIDLTTVDYPNPERFTRMLENQEFDLAEVSTGSYLASKAHPEDYPFTAIPVFPYRKLRHSYIYVRDGAGIDSPADLNGARVGTINWQTTTGIWQRGILADHHGLDLESVEWVTGSPEIVPVDPTRFDVTALDPDPGSSMPTLERHLEQGDLDALCIPVVPTTDMIVRLFDDPLETERDYVRETGIFPIMHTVLVHDDLIEEHPWTIQKLYDAFVEAKSLAMDTLDRPRWMPLAQSRLLAEQQREVLGDDPWQYGLTETNRTTLETLIDYAYDQQVAAERYDVDSLFETDYLETGWFTTD